MYKLILLAFVAVVILGCDAKPDGITTFPLQSPSYEYEVDTWGFNSEVYEITPKANEEYTCLMWMLDAGNSMSIDCFPKPTKLN